jgi:hypothetical protein
MNSGALQPPFTSAPRAIMAWHIWTSPFMQAAPNDVKPAWSSRQVSRQVKVRNNTTQPAAVDAAAANSTVGEAGL